MSINFTKNVNPATIGTLRFNIISGPSADRLIDAFKYAYGENHVRAKFTITGKGANELKTENDIMDCSLRIQSLEHEDGSGHSFNMKGAIEDASAGNTKIPFHNLKFTGYYNAKLRIGHLVIFHQ